jgi:hypothetical protein
MDWCITTIKKRSVAGGGFADRPGGHFRPDATCWAILALRAAHAESDLAHKAAKTLAATQHPDGRVCISRRHKDAYWPTSLAVLAWAGLTLSLKNLFGLMPGLVYGWPKNVFHWAGIPQAILDIHATVRPHFAILDGIEGMEGDGPIMGTPKHAGVLVLGRDLAAVDATAARIMGIDPGTVPYLRAARGWLGTVSAEKIVQRGETIAAVQTPFGLLQHIPAYQGLRRLTTST